MPSLTVMMLMGLAAAEDMSYEYGGCCGDRTYDRAPMRGRSTKKTEKQPLAKCGARTRSGGF